VATDPKLELPFSSIDVDELVSVFYRLSDYIAIHEIVFDEWNSIVDARLVWWNKHYEDVRRNPVHLDQRMNETYFQPHISLAHIAEAWMTGHSLQLFEMGDETQKFFQLDGKNTSTWVNWQRLGDHIVEVGCDVEEASELQKLINDQRTLVAIAGRKRAIAVERERIARNLHDVVIQNLYATSLSLAVVGRNKDMETQKAFNDAISAIDGVISEIRREILHVESRKASPLRLQLEDVLIPVLNPTDTELELLIEVSSLPDRVESHVRAVCVEGASNAVRHGGATLLKIRIARIMKNLVLTIEDNGCGIPSQARLQNGLHNMRERAEALGGNMEIHTVPNHGTTVTWSVPCRGCNPSAALCEGCAI
jgi:signal transduction histidine kinase